MKLLSLLALGALAAFTNAAAIDGGLVEKRCLEGMLQHLDYLLREYLILLTFDYSGRGLSG